MKMPKKLTITPPTKIKIVEIPGKGLGVMATADIKKGENIEIFPVLFLSKKDVKYLDHESDLLTFYPMYLQSYRKDCIMFGYGSIYNHDRKNPNADIFYPKNKTDRYLIMRAIKKISKGEEVVYDYGYDGKQEFLDLK
jgi:SET domain-containing protein